MHKFFSDHLYDLRSRYRGRENEKIEIAKMLCQSIFMFGIYVPKMNKYVTRNEESGLWTQIEFTRRTL